MPPFPGPSATGPTSLFPFDILWRLCNGTSRRIATCFESSPAPYVAVHHDSPAPQHHWTVRSGLPLSPEVDRGDRREYRGRGRIRGQPGNVRLQGEGPDATRCGATLLVRSARRSRRSPEPHPPIEG